jgi:hypothetical protein
MKRVVVVLLIMVLVTLAVAPAFAKAGGGSSHRLVQSYRTITSGRAKGHKAYYWRWECNCGKHGSWVGFDWQAEAAWKIHKLLGHH